MKMKTKIFFTIFFVMLASIIPILIIHSISGKVTVIIATLTVVVSATLIDFKQPIDWKFFARELIASFGSSAVMCLVLMWENIG